MTDSGGTAWIDALVIALAIMLAMGLLFVILRGLLQLITTPADDPDWLRLIKRLGLPAQATVLGSKVGPESMVLVLETMLDRVEAAAERQREFEALTAKLFEELAGKATMVERMERDSG